MTAAQHVSFHQVEALTARLVTLTHDPEAFHGAEDELYERVLQTIADGAAEDPAKLAAEVLKARDIPGQRWFA